MRRFAVRVAPALLTFVIGVGAGHLWQIIAGRQAPGGTPTDYGVEGERGKFLRHAGGIPGQYIVVLDGSVSEGGVETIAAELAGDHGGKVQFVYRSAPKGFSVVEMPEEAAVAISRDPRVSYVESNVRGELD